MTEKHVDDLVREHQQKQHELQILGDKLKKSARPVVVCFIDLAGSTALKTKVAPAEWLGYVYQFLAAVDGHARSSGGTVVKRIGDELMVVFPDTNASEQFLSQLEADKNITTASFKAAVDCGEAYYLRFAKGLEDDPYGPVVDRCARIAKLAGPGAVLCSATYQRQVGGGLYVLAGSFPMKGFTEPEDVFLRQPAGIDSEYLKPLLEALNERRIRIGGYTSLPRHFDQTYIGSLGNSRARPFIARALLNVPRLPDSPQALEQRFRAPQGIKEVGRIRGYYIEWIVAFEAYEIQHDNIQVTAKLTENQWYNTVWVSVVPSMLEIVERFTPGQRLRLRGILMEIFISNFRVNYADFEVVESGKKSKKDKQ